MRKFTYGIYSIQVHYSLSCFPKLLSVIYIINNDLINAQENQNSSKDHHEPETIYINKEEED